MEFPVPAPSATDLHPRASLPANPNLPFNDSNSPIRLPLSGDTERPVPTIPSAIAVAALIQSPACIMSDAGSNVWLNEAWHGFAGDDDTGASWTLLIYPPDRDTAQERLSLAVSSGKGGDFECRLQDASGKARWFLLSLQPMPVAPDEDRAWLCIAADIHDLKRGENELRQQASIQADMLNVSVDCIKMIALDGTLLYMNKAGCQALGVAEDSAFGMPWLSLLPEGSRATGEEALASVRAGASARFDGRSVIPGHETQYWDNMLSPVTSPGGIVTSILCMSRNVTAERQATDAMRTSQERLEVAAVVGGLGIWDLDIERNELHCDDAWYKIMGRDPADPIRTLEEFRPFIHPDDADRSTEVPQTAAQLIAAGEDYTIVFRVVRPNGDIRWVRSAACIQTRNDKAVRAIGFVVDITDAWRGELALRDANRTLEAEKSSLARQSLEDPLTGIANRRHLDAELTRICIHSGETGEPMCVGMMDVDHFKAYNDRYGHMEGDQALRRVAGALQSVARQSDFIARYGGEEFTFVLAGVSDPAFVLQRFSEAIADLAIPHDTSPTGILTVSAGCVVFNSCDGLSPASMLKASDEALYEAKASGRNRHVIRWATGRPGDRPFRYAGFLG